MRDRKKRNITIISLCCLLVFMAVGYAMLSQTLNIDGTANLTGEWKIYIDSITEITEGNTTSGKSITAEVTGEEKTDAYFEAELIKPGDYVKYKVVVKNGGNIDASLRNIETSVDENEYVKFNHTATLGTVVRSEESLEFEVKVEFDEDAEEIPETKEYAYSVSLVFEQYDGNQLTTPPSMDTNNSCFTVSADGTLENYDYNCGLDVVVPASVDDIPITSITTTSLAPTKETLVKMGYVEYRRFSLRFNDESTLVSFLVAPDDYSYSKLLESFLVENVELPKASFVVYEKGALEEIYVYTYSTALLLDSEGNETAMNPAYAIYTYWSPEEFYVAETQEAYDAMLVYAQNQGIDTNLVYLAGDSDIPRDTYRVKLSDVINGENDSVTVLSDVKFYTDGTIDIGNNLSGLITTLDLSNTFYLEEITTQNQFQALEKLILPSNGNLTTIGNSAFRNSKLTNVTIPSTVKTIGNEAFYLCDDLEIIYMEPYSSNITLGENWNGGASVHWINN